MKTTSIPLLRSAPPLSPIRPVFHSHNPLRLPSKSPALRVSADHYRIEVRRVSYRPPGTQHNLLSEVSFSLPQKSFGLIFGRSGSGKTTLLQLLAGLSKPTSGSINIQRYRNDGNPNGPPQTLSPERVGIVFQFPERYLLADTVLEEVTFGWPRQKADLALREQLALKLQFAINSVGLNTISLEEDPHSLSGGFKRRLALAIQLVQMPDLLLLDEPLAGLDWRARADVVKLLKHLKNELTLLVGTIKSGGSIMEDGNGRDAKGRTPTYMMLQVPFPVPLFA
ncbi:ABC transporter I family member 11, chloroplastic isoform X2 [Phoenix dactylifera]|uniref:ABC transporter I family member 11, chloroplastic isoform X2 n=1 Tax=Phoenix dactylifera TaxID=42345 RepID=A0A8B7CYU0_PHODC|nr:ABC transporter I family member 11, chloroplastic isoform X2 [Phoenix dactylifera]